MRQKKWPQLFLQRLANHTLESDRGQAGGEVYRFRRITKMEKSPPGCKKKLLTTQWATDTLSENSKSFLIIKSLKHLEKLARLSVLH